MREADAILEQALQLPENERAELVLRLTESLEAQDGVEGRLDLAWADEVARRVQSIRDGCATTVPADEALARAHARLNTIRD